MILIRISGFVILIILVIAFVAGVVLGGRYISKVFDLLPATGTPAITNSPTPGRVSEPTPPATSAPTPSISSTPSISGDVSWTFEVTGFQGNRWDAWEIYVKGNVPGLTWKQFKDQVLIHNPDLETDGYIFKPDKSYLLPEVK